MDCKREIGHSSCATKKSYGKVRKKVKFETGDMILVYKQALKIVPFRFRKSFDSLGKVVENQDLNTAVIKRSKKER